MSVKELTVTRWQCTCDRPKCKHKWQTKTDQLPKVCPACKQPNWNTKQPFTPREKKK